MDVRKFFPLPGIFPLKIENHLQKICKKIFQSCVLNLLLPGLMKFSPRRSRSEHFRFARPMSALPPKADVGTHSRNVRFVPKADIRALVPRSPSVHCNREKPRACSDEHYASKRSNPSAERSDLFQEN